MGTRAIITKNGEPFIATHWDGYISGLGRDLATVYTDDEIIKVASEHTIDFASADIREKANDIRVKELAEKYSLSEDEIRAGDRRGNFFSAGDWLVGAIENYGDWAEYQYDLIDGVWFARSLSGAWPDSYDGDWKDLDAWIEEGEEEE